MYKKVLLPYWVLCALALLILVTHHNSLAEQLTIKQQAIATARKTSPKISLAFLGCYALPKPDKQLCWEKLARQYLSNTQRQLSEFVLEFSYEAEKLGFVTFLNNHGHTCLQVDQGPIYLKDKQAYLVKCTNHTEYLMRYNYKTKNWIMLNNFTAKTEVYNEESKNKPYVFTRL